MALDHVFKILILGDAGVGKSSLLIQYSDGVFETNIQSTVGVDFKIRQMQIEGPDGRLKNVKITLWDTAGQERFRSLTSSYYRGAQAIVLVFDVTKETTFNHVPMWKREVDEYASKKEVIKILVGNKVDQEGARVVSSKQAADFAAEAGMIYIEASAVSKDSVNALFGAVVSHILRTPALLVSTRPNKGGVKVVDEDESLSIYSAAPEPSSGCCSR